MLEPLGLDASLESVYRALLAHPDWRVTDMATHLGLTEKEVRGLLDRLTDLSLLRVGDGEPGSFRPVSPQFGLSALLARSQAELLERQRQIEQTRAAIASISDEYSSVIGGDRESIERLEGLGTVRARLEELAQAARVECLSFVPGRAQRSDTMRASKPLNRSALERGVRIKSVYQESCRNDPTTLRYMRWLHDLGGYIRTTPSLPLTMVIVDREVALVPLDSSDPRQGALQIRSPGVVAALAALFQQFWDSAAPFGAAPATDKTGLSPLERELIRLLGEGHTDERAARTLGLSLRTVRRMMSALMLRLDAESRFQAGVRAMQAGWLPSQDG
ncbi:MAG: helix-turn-helix transcriptional regulator [Actinomadura sp.]